MKNSLRSSSVRSVLALLVGIGLTYFILDYCNRVYYEPICQRHADSQQLTYWSYSAGRIKQGIAAECFFRDRNGNLARVEVAQIPQDSSDRLRWVLTWAADLAGVGVSVWLASLISGFKVRRRRC